MNGKVLVTGMPEIKVRLTLGPLTIVIYLVNSPVRWRDKAISVQWPPVVGCGVDYQLHWLYVNIVGQVDVNSKVGPHRSFDEACQ